MSEKTIPKALAGDEVIDVICNQVRLALNRDCLLSPHLAYPSFSFKALIDIKFQNTGTKIEGTMATAGYADGQLDPDLSVEEGTVEAEYEPKAPNEVRRENDIGVPVIVTDAAGHQTEKKIKYARKG